MPNAKPQARKHFCEELYEFPDLTLQSYSREQLLALIESDLPTAMDMVDGTDASAGPRIDFAQDRIEQARDLLLDAGEIFSPAQQERLSFIRWPLTEEQITRQEAELKRERAERDAAAKIHQFRSDFVREKIKAAMNGVYIDTPDQLAGISLVMSDSGKSYVDGIMQNPFSGAQVLHLVESLKAAGASSAKLEGYCCSGPFVTFETDPGPLWTITLDAPHQPEVWTLLLDWWDTGVIPRTPHARIDCPDSYYPDFQLDVYLADIWPSSRLDRLVQTILDYDSLDAGECAPPSFDAPIEHPSTALATAGVTMQRSGPQKILQRVVRRFASAFRKAR